MDSLEKSPVLDWGGVEFQYANSTQTQASNWDFRMLFSDRISESNVVPKVGIVMGHQHAKAFHRALGKTIEKLEKMMGAPIRFEPKTDEE
jgi:hypothetical protein